MPSEKTSEYIEAATGDSATIAVSQIIDLAVKRINAADSEAEKMRELSAVGDAIVQLSQSSDTPDRVISTARDQAGALARNTSTSKKVVWNPIEDKIKETEKNQIEKKGGYRVDHGIGLDRLLEEHLEEVVIQRSTDHVDSPVFRWRFDDGKVVETAEGIHFDHYHFFKQISDSTDRRVVPELASEKAEDSADSEEEYAELSLGPRDRPWSRSGDLWERSISGLIEERASEQVVVGPRTEAWESIQDRIASGRAVRDLDDAVQHGMLYVDDDNEEIWVPTSTVGNAVESVETSRRALQSELTERGVDTDELSGGSISEAVTRKGVAKRYWRLDASHEEVPEPETVMDEVDDPTQRAIGADDDSPPARGTETFGRSKAETDGGKEGDSE